jgi:hypothetical protein
LLVNLIYLRILKITFLDCGKTKLPIWSGLVWGNSIYLRARFLGELLKNIMGDKLM